MPPKNNSPTDGSTAPNFKGSGGTSVSMTDGTLEFFSSPFLSAQHQSRDGVNSSRRPSRQFEEQAADSSSSSLHSQHSQLLPSRSNTDGDGGGGRRNPVEGTEMILKPQDGTVAGKESLHARRRPIGQMAARRRSLSSIGLRTKTTQDLSLPTALASHSSNSQKRRGSGVLLKGFESSPPAPKLTTTTAQQQQRLMTPSGWYEGRTGLDSTASPGSISLDVIPGHALQQQQQDWQLEDRKPNFLTVMGKADPAAAATTVLPAAYPPSSFLPDTFPVKPDSAQKQISDISISSSISAPHDEIDTEELSSDNHRRDHDNYNGTRASLLSGDRLAEKTQSARAPLPFCCLPANPKAWLILCMMAIFLCFISMPIASMLILQPLHTYLNVDVPLAVKNFVDASRMSVAVNEFEDMIQLFSYYGDNFPKEVIEISEVNRRRATDGLSSSVHSEGISSSPAVIAVESFLLSLFDGASELSSNPVFAKDAAVILEWLDEYYKEGFPAVVEEILKQQQRLVEGNLRSTIRNEIANQFYTNEATAVLSRGPNLMQEARLACMDLEPCWTGGGREVLDNISTLANKIGAGASAVINDVFTLIDDPRGDSASLQEMVSRSMSKVQLRTALLLSMEGWYEELTALLEKLTLAESAPVSPGDPVLITPDSLAIFAIPKDFQKTVATAVNHTRVTAQLIHDYFNAHSPVSEWLSSGASVDLEEDLSDHEILSCVRVFYSYYGINISKSLTLSYTPEEEKESTINYETGTTTAFISHFHVLINAMRDATAINLSTHLDVNSLFPYIKVHRSALIALLTTLGVSLLLYVMLLYVVRYRLVSSPFPFITFAGVLFFLFLTQTGMSAGIYMITVGAPEHTREMSHELLTSVTEKFDSIFEISTALSLGLRMFWLIDANYTVSLENLKKLEDFPIPSFSEGESRPWMKPFAEFMALTIDLVDSGFFSIRQQVTPSSSLPLTMKALADLIGIGTLEPPSTSTTPTVNPTVAAELEGCWAGIGSAATNLMTSSYVSLIAISERLSSGTKRIDTVTTSRVTFASFESNCVAAIAESAVDPTKMECFLPEICSAPSSYGLLRDVRSAVGMYQVFDPEEEDGMGRVLKVWVEASQVAIPQEFEDLLTNMITAARVDIIELDKKVRLIIWMGVFTCLAMQLIALFLWQVLFGSSFFGKWLM